MHTLFSIFSICVIGKLLHSDNVYNMYSTSMVLCSNVLMISFKKKKFINGHLFFVYQLNLLLGRSKSALSDISQAIQLRPTAKLFLMRGGLLLKEQVSHSFCVFLNISIFDSHILNNLEKAQRDE